MLEITFIHYVIPPRKAKIVVCAFPEFSEKGQHLRHTF